MLQQISDYLFLGSLVLLIISLLRHFSGRGMANYNSILDNASGATTDLQMEHKHKEVIDRQDSMLRRIFRSYLFWISIIGLALSVVLSKI